MSAHLVRARRKRSSRVPKDLHGAEHAIFLAACAQSGIPAPSSEYVIIPSRKFRWDYAWPSMALALEVQGGIWNRGAHGRGSGIARDHEKHNLATAAGWSVLYCQPRDLCTTATLDLIRATLAMRSAA